ncbi:hypothetical protein ACIBCN_04045 [Nocardia sp. NPDC051052]|uniref:hypothetical protein n=1 Tax=Nocardia sp. NPDC051052 TaxID=3364322 RepID=UPI0037A898DE
MNRISALTTGALLSAAVLLPLAPAQAEAPQPALEQVSTDGSSGSSMQSLTCTILRLILLNQGPASCA